MPSFNPNVFVGLIATTIGCVGFAILFKIKGRQVIYSGIGSCLTWTVYLLAMEGTNSNFYSVFIASIFVAAYAEVMARVNKAPATIFLTASVFPLIPGANLYYMMNDFVNGKIDLALNNAEALALTCLGIGLGFIVVEIFNKYIALFINIIKKRLQTGKEK